MKIYFDSYNTRKTINLKLIIVKGNITKTKTKNELSITTKA